MVRLRKTLWERGWFTDWSNSDSTWQERVSSVKKHKEVEKL
jgi:hypothetical protein